MLFRLMQIDMKKQILLMTALLVMAVFFGHSVPLVAAQKGNDYKMPFRSTEIWKTDFDYGVHRDSVGTAFDFYAPVNSTKDILAISDGILTRGCTVNGATRLRLDTTAGDTVRFFHMQATTVPIDSAEDVYVKQGDVLGKVTDGGLFDDGSCKLSSDYAHLHFSWTNDLCPFSIGGNTFDCGDMKDCAGIGIYRTNCNQKYLGAAFLSNNIAIDYSKDCGILLSKTYNIGDRGLEIVSLQRCLVQQGLYKHSGGVSGYYGNYTNDTLNKYKAGVTVPIALPTVNDCGGKLGQNYSIGNSGQSIRELQNCLKDLGYFQWSGGSTGLFGNYTNEVYNKWLNQDNNVCKILKTKQFNVGERSKRVEKLQQCLREAGLFSYPTNTGLFGEITKVAWGKW
jgi:hypothetical protein